MVGKQSLLYLLFVDTSDVSLPVQTALMLGKQTRVPFQYFGNVGGPSELGKLATGVATGQGKVREIDFSSRSGKSQGILQITQGNFKYQESQGIS